MRVQIKNDQRGLLFKKGNYVRHCKPGEYLLNPFGRDEIIILELSQAFTVEGKHLNLFLNDPALLEELVVVEVEDYQMALHFVDGKLSEVLGSGKYAFWKALQQHHFKLVDLRNPEISPEIDLAVYSNPKLRGVITCFEIANHEQGVLYYNHVLQRVLQPGRYFFWKSPVQVMIRNVDLRQQQLEMNGQEMMTEDKITLRLNFICHYKVVDPLKMVLVKGFEEQLYTILQLVLREYVGTQKLDELLLKKQEIGSFVLQKLQEKGLEFGVTFLFAGVKDLILPGEIREILNTVLVAEKKAQANLILRREEVASTRSLLNTAKLMDENQTLYRLKELEFLEKICERIGNISFNGNGSLLEQLNGLVNKSK